QQRRQRFRMPPLRRLGLSRVPSPVAFPWSNQRQRQRQCQKRNEPTVPLSFAPHETEDAQLPRRFCPPPSSSSLPSVPERVSLHVHFSVSAYLRKSCSRYFETES